jgi:succinyl-CoA synthetase beta subunit
VSMVCNLTIGKTQYRDFEEELKSVLTKAEELRARELAFQLGLNIKQVARAVATIMSAYRAFRDCDATMLEINPLVLTKDDRIVALDAKMSFDDTHCSDGTT